MNDKSVRRWHVDPSLAGAIEEVLPDLAQDILDTIAREVPEYARPLEGSFGRGIRVGVDEALRQFVALIREPSAGRGAGRDVYVALGRGELNQGRSLDSLQAAYRIGARVAWQKTSLAAERAGHPPERIYELADAIFAYIDELSSESVEGYAAAQSAREGEREKRRSRLLTALVSGRDAAEMERLATSAGWAIPATVAAATCRPEDAAAVARRLGPETLSGTADELGCLIIPDPDAPGAPSRLGSIPAGSAMTVGPTLAPDRAAESWAEAKAAYACRAAGAFGSATGLLRTEDHLAELILAEHPARLERIRRRRLASLDEGTQASVTRLRETLSAWLRNQGAIGATATDLHVHPQTVRYRMARLRDLLGAQLDDPDARFEIEMALRGGVGPAGR